MQRSALIIPLSVCDENDSELVGAKAARLGQILQADSPPPQGFIISAAAYYLFVKENRLDIKIKHLLGTVNFEHTGSLTQVAAHIRRLIKTTPIPAKIVDEVFSAYSRMTNNPSVAVIPSPVDDDLNNTSHLETFLNVGGESVLMEKVRDSWASLFEARAVFQRNEVKLDHLKVGVAVVIQKMSDFEKNSKEFMLETKPEEISKVRSETVGEPMLLGDPASPGIGIGKVKIINHLSDFQSFESGMVLVTKDLSLDLTAIVKKAAAVIVESGGKMSDAIVLAREHGIPAVVGTSLATEKLKNGDVVSVNGGTGNVFAGSVRIEKEKSGSNDIKTATKLNACICDSKEVIKIKDMNVDGVELLGSELIFKNIGTHPKKLISEGKESEFIDKLGEDIAEICRMFYPKPVIYTLADLDTNEYASLHGGKDYEHKEHNPTLGYKGAMRAINDPKVFKLELAAVKKVREKMGFKNLSLMLPFVRTVDELRRVKKIIHDEGLVRSHTFKLLISVDVPASVILIDDFIEEGIDGVCVNTENLSMLILGLDRKNNDVEVGFNEQDPAVLWVYERVIRAATKHGIEVEVSLDGSSQAPDLIEKIVHLGATSISVPPESVDNVRALIHTAEKKLIKKLETGGQIPL